MTKQGVRDLNHLVPKKRPAEAAVAETAVAADAAPIAAPAVIPQAVEITPA